MARQETVGTRFGKVSFSRAVGLVVGPGNKGKRERLAAKPVPAEPYAAAA